MGSGEELSLRYVLAPSKYVLGKFWIWAGGVNILIFGGSFINGGGDSICVCIYTCVYIYIYVAGKSYAHISLSLSIYIYIYTYRHVYNLLTPRQRSYIILI